MSNSNRKLSFALFGCGRIGRMHARNIASNPRAVLSVCYDIAADAASQAAAALDCRAATSIDDILSDPGIDAIFIASTTDTHVDLIRRSVQARKPVLCEKPIDLDIA